MDPKGSTGPEDPGSDPGRSTTRGRTLRVLGYVLAWAVVALPAWSILFTHSSAELVLASHDAVVRPTFDGWVRLDMGPYLPDLRTPSNGRIGIAVQMRKTTATTAPELAQRYAAIAVRPEAEEDRAADVVGGLARNAALQAVVVGLVPIGLWVLVGPRRLAELRRRENYPGARVVAVAIVGGVVAALLVVQPWHTEPDRVQASQRVVPSPSSSIPNCVKRSISDQFHATR